jgi:hypothetical protein
MSQLAALCMTLSVAAILHVFVRDDGKLPKRTGGAERNTGGAERNTITDIRTAFTETAYIDDIRFGVEVETVLVLSRTVFPSDTITVKLGDLSLERRTRLTEVLNECHNNVKFVDAVGVRGGREYFNDCKTWMITVDYSVKNTTLISDTDLEESVIIENVELVSPICALSERYSLLNLEPVHKMVRHTHNATTSAHIHISSSALSDVETVYNFCLNFAMFEPVILSMCSRSRDANVYATTRPMLVILHKLKEAQTTADLTLADIQRAFSNKYATVHMDNLVEDNRIEFRFKNGSALQKENIMFVDLLARLLKASTGTKIWKTYTESRRLTKFFNAALNGGVHRIRACTLDDMFELLMSSLKDYGDDACSDDIFYQYFRTRFDNMHGYFYFASSAASWNRHRMVDLSEIQSGNLSGYVTADEDESGSESDLSEGEDWSVSATDLPEGEDGSVPATDLPEEDGSASATDWSE